MKIQGPQSQRTYIIVRDQKSNLHGTSFQSSQDPFAYHESLQHQTIAVLLLKIPIFFFQPLSSVHLFQSNQRFLSDRTCGPTRFRKALNLIFPKLSLQNMRGFDHATTLSPSFHGLR